MSNFIDEFLTSGGVDDQLVTIRNARFTRDIGYRDGQEPFLCVDIVPDDPDVSAHEDARIGLGKDWTESDDEAEVSKVNGGKAAFHKSSKIGRLLESMGKAPGFRETIEARMKAGDTPPPPTTAAFWEGLRGTIRQAEDKITFSDGREPQSFNFYVFSDIEGWEGQKAAKPAKKAASKKAAEKAEDAEEKAEAPKPAKKAAAKKAAAVKEPEEEIEESVEEPVEETPATAGDGDFKAKLAEHCAATTAESHVDWMVEAYEAFAEELTANPEFQPLVDEETAVWTEVWGG